MTTTGRGAHPAMIRFWRLFVRQGRGILTALEQALNEMEREGESPEAIARAEATERPTRALTDNDLQEIAKLVRYHANGQS